LDLAYQIRARDLFTADISRVGRSRMFVTM